MSSPISQPGFAEKEKNKNGGITVPGKKRRTLIIRIILITLIFIASFYLWENLILPGSSAPQIDLIDYHQTYLDGDVRVEITIYFHDSEGDVTTFVHEFGYSASILTTIASTPVNFSPGKQRRGAFIEREYICNRDVDNGFNFIDAMGNESGYVFDTVDCYDASVVEDIRVQATENARGE